MSESVRMTSGSFSLSSALTRLVINLLRLTGLPGLASQTAGHTWRVVYSVTKILVTIILILASSFFLYAAFYHAYMPAKVIKLKRKYTIEFILPVLIAVI